VILISGGTGTISSELVKLLAPETAQVRVMGRRTFAQFARDHAEALRRA
jgi:uncharacterized protein YbjT (DUF2867 family)